MKIIIVGCGKVGLTLAERLNQENHDITLIDSDYTTVRTAADSLDVMAVTGNGAIYQVQMEAGIKEADLLIATTNSDELNILCCLIAKKTGNCHTFLWPLIPNLQRLTKFPGCFASPRQLRLIPLPRAGLNC